MPTAHTEAQHSSTRRRVRRSWPWLFLLLPLGVYLYFLPGFGAAQNNDYFGSITSILGAELDGLEQVKRYVFARSNEHRIAVPMLVYRANLGLFGGSNRPLSAFAVAMMLAVFLMLYRCLPPPVRQQPAKRLAFGLVLACFAFTPVAAHNIAMGFSGTMWFLANVAFVAALTLLCQRTAGTSSSVTGPGVTESGVTVEGVTGPGMWGWISVALAGAIGLFSYSTSLAMWPALLVAALCLGLSWRHHLALVAMAGLAYGYYFTTYRTPGHLPSPNTGEPGKAVEFFGIYLGGIFTTDLNVARRIGWCGAIAFITLVVTVLVRRRDRLPMLAPWMAIMVFALVNAVGTSIGRSSFSARMGVASRYATLPGLFWSGLLICLGLLLWTTRSADRPARRRGARAMAMVLVAAAAIALVVAMYGRGVPLLEAFVDRAHNQRLAELALVRGHKDVEALRMLTPAPNEAWRSRDIFIRLGHHPFDRPPQAPPTILEPLGTSPPDGLMGGILSRGRTAEGTLRPTGWAAMPAGTPKIVDWAIADADGRTVGALVGSMGTPPSARQVTDERFAGWGGYAIGIQPQNLHAFVRLDGNSTWYPLPQSP